MAKRIKAVGKKNQKAGRDAAKRRSKSKRTKVVAEISSLSSQARSEESPPRSGSEDFVDHEHSEEYKLASREDASRQSSRKATGRDAENIHDSDVEKHPSAGRDAEKYQDSDVDKHLSVSSECSDADEQFPGSRKAGNSRSGASDADLGDVGGQSAKDVREEGDDDCRIIDNVPVPIKPAPSPPRARAAAHQEQEKEAFITDAAAATADIARSKAAEASILKLEVQLAAATKAASAQRLEQETAQEAVDLLQKNIDELTKVKRAHEVEMAARLLRKVVAPEKKGLNTLPPLPPYNQQEHVPPSHSEAHDAWVLQQALDASRDSPSGKRPERLLLDRDLGQNALLERIRMLEHAQHADRTDTLSLRNEKDGWLYEKFDLDGQVRELRERAEAAEARIRPETVHERLSNAEYASRFQMLMQAGHAMSDAHEALETTKISGTWSVQRAVLFLQKQQKERLTSSVAKANEQGSELPNIIESSALAKLLCEKLEFADIICKVRELHAKQRARNAHQAKPAVVAANLVELSAVKSDVQLQRCGYAFLCRIASAASEDCEQCKSLRDKLEADEQGKAKAAKSAEIDKAYKAIEQKRSAEALEMSNKRQREPERLRDAPFKLSDSKRDQSKPHVPCSKCHLGQEGGKWILFCSTGNCSRGYHYQCSLDFLQYRLPNGDTRFACEPCQKQRQELVASGAVLEAWELVVQTGEAPDHGEAVAADARLNYQGAGGAASTRTKDPPHAAGDSTRQGDRIAGIISDFYWW